MMCQILMTWMYLDRLVCALAQALFFINHFQLRKHLFTSDRMLKLCNDIKLYHLAHSIERLLGCVAHQHV